MIVRESAWKGGTEYEKEEKKEKIRPKRNGIGTGMNEVSRDKM